MEYRILGKSGIKTSLISLGTWTTIGDSLSSTESQNLLQTAFDFGINLIDTAENYNDGKTEKAIGKALSTIGIPREKYLLSSKTYWGNFGKYPNTFGLSRKHIIEACNASLRRLQTEYIDLYYCHRTDQAVPIEETVMTMNHLINQGKILYWGTSKWPIETLLSTYLFCQKNNYIAPIAEQPKYNLFCRGEVETGYDHFCKALGLGIIAWGVLESGVLVSESYCSEKIMRKLLSSGLLLHYTKNEILFRVKKFSKLAKNIGTSPVQLAIGWCLSNNNISSVIVGAKDSTQLKETIGALNLIPILTKEIVTKLENIFPFAKNRTSF